MSPPGAFTTPHEGGFSFESATGRRWGFLAAQARAMRIALGLSWDDAEITWQKAGALTQAVFFSLWLSGCLLIPCKTDHFLYLLRLVICCSKGECIKNTWSFLNLTPETNMILSVNYLEFKYKLGKKLFKREIIYKYQNSGRLHWYVHFLTFSHQVILDRPLLTLTFFLMLILKLIMIPFFLRNKYWKWPGKGTRSHSKRLELDKSFRSSGLSLRQTLEEYIVTHTNQTHIYNKIAQTSIKNIQRFRVSSLAKTSLLGAPLHQALPLPLHPLHHPSHPDPKPVLLKGAGGWREPKR